MKATVRTTIDLDVFWTFFQTSWRSVGLTSPKQAGYTSRWTSHGRMPPTKIQQVNDQRSNPPNKPQNNLFCSQKITQHVLTELPTLSPQKKKKKHSLRPFLFVFVSGASPFVSTVASKGEESPQSPRGRAKESFEVGRKQVDDRPVFFFLKGAFEWFFGEWFCLMVF